MEKNRIHKPRKEVAKCVDDKTQDKKCVESLQNQIMGVFFNLQNSQLLTLSVTK